MSCKTKQWEKKESATNHFISVLHLTYLWYLIGELSRCGLTQCSIS